MPTRKLADPCQWVSQGQAFRHFAVYDGRTQSQQHIKPLHWYVTCRLVLEGGFHPDELKPRPPFRVTRRRRQNLIHFDPSTATGGEATVFGGLKTKKVDVVVTKPQLGPVLAVSCKGITGAFRNLTNRMEMKDGCSTTRCGWRTYSKRVFHSPAKRIQPTNKRQSPPFPEIASSTLGGDMGNSVIRIPRARLTALPTAASGATMGVSPQPRTP